MHEVHEEQMDYPVLVVAETVIPDRPVRGDVEAVFGRHLLQLVVSDRIVARHVIVNRYLTARLVVLPETTTFPVLRNASPSSLLREDILPI